MLNVPLGLGSVNLKIVIIFLYCRTSEKLQHADVPYDSAREIREDGISWLLGH